MGNQPSLAQRLASAMATPLPRLAFLWANCFSFMNDVVLVIAILSTIATVYMAWRLMKRKGMIPTVTSGNAFERGFNFVMKNI